MKIRQGFVSNSSSSSFLIYGFFFENGNEDEDLFCKVESLYYNSNDDFWNFIQNVDDGERFIIGYTLAYIEGTEEVDLDMSDLTKKKQKVIDKFKKKGIDFSNRKFSYILGEHYS